MGSMPPIGFPNHYSYGVKSIPRYVLSLLIFSPTGPTWMDLGQYPDRCFKSTRPSCASFEERLLSTEKRIQKYRFQILLLNDAAIVPSAFATSWLVTNHWCHGEQVWGRIPESLTLSLIHSRLIEQWTVTVTWIRHQVDDFGFPIFECWLDGREVFFWCFCGIMLQHVRKRSYFKIRLTSERKKIHKRATSPIVKIQVVFRYLLGIFCSTRLYRLHKYEASCFLSVFLGEMLLSSAPLPTD